MGMTSSIGRSLFAKVPPSIVINEPLPRWKAIALTTLRVAGVVLLSAMLFYAGMQFERFRLKRVQLAQALASEPATAPSNQAAAAPRQTGSTPPAKQDVMEVRALEGLTIQTFEVARDAAVPNQLRYQLAVANEGRLYEGTLEFLVVGTVEGRASSWVYPPAAQRAAGQFQMRVGRYFKTEGKIALPPGMVPEAVALRLREASGSVRASRGVTLVPSELPKKSD